MRFISILGQLWLLQTYAQADVQLPKIFTDHMVIQQELLINIWGKADVGEKVTVSLNGKSVTTHAREDRAWRLALPAMKTDGKTHTLKVQGNNTIELQNILIGEVWLCSGQSNMGRPVPGAAIEKANYPNIRLFHVNGKTPRRGDLDEVVGWLVCTPEAVRTSGDGSRSKRRPFSEVAYEFGRRLHEVLKVPVGIIQSNTGGSTAKDWTPLPDAETKFPFDKEIARLKHTPGACYRVKLRGLIPLTIRGAIWYQGEDDGRNRKYTDDLTKMIEAWRTNWGRKDLPFYMAQIAQTTYASGMLGVTESHVQVMHTVPHTGLASSNNLQDRNKRPDKGNPRRKIKGTGWPIVSGGNPHPPNKHIVAGRLADIALAKLYAKLQREVFGPILDTHEIKNGKAITSAPV
ncbi:MAG: sialate O-acetylesterase [Planctomycetota bacterium]|nr:sialate O-acetylesterase [Planctomycetota bacterium]MDP7251694.1 sialate O-acetylesterase [Planctomycetota bacterium]